MALFSWLSLSLLHIRSLNFHLFIHNTVIVVGGFCSLLHELLNCFIQSYTDQAACQIVSEYLSKPHHCTVIHAHLSNQQSMATIVAIRDRLWYV